MTNAGWTTRIVLSKLPGDLEVDIEDLALETCYVQKSRLQTRESLLYHLLLFVHYHHPSDLGIYSDTNLMLDDIVYLSCRDPLLKMLTMEFKSWPTR